MSIGSVDSEAVLYCSDMCYGQTFFAVDFVLFCYTYMLYGLPLFRTLNSNRMIGRLCNYLLHDQCDRICNISAVSLVVSDSHSLAGCIALLPEALSRHLGPPVGLLNRHYLDIVVISTHILN